MCTDIISRFLFIAERFPDETALTYKNRSYTYQELNRITDIMATSLRKYTISGTVIGILLEKSAEYVISILGILKAGYTYLPLDSVYPISRIQMMLIDCGCQVIISDKENEDIKGEIIFIYELLNVQKNLHKYEDREVKKTEVEFSLINEHKYPYVHYPYIIYTSGSTGKPKGIRIEAKAVLNLVEQMSIQIQCSKGKKRIGMISPFVFDVSVGQMYMALLYGNELVLVSDETKYSLVLLTEWLAENKIYCCDFTPTRLELQVSYYEKHMKKHIYPEIVVSVGEPISTGLAKRVIIESNCNTRIFNYYGPSEICVYCAYHEISKADLQDESKNIPIGMALKGFQLYILNEDMCPCEINEIGELYIAGIGVSKEGYLNNPELNKCSFLVNPDNLGQRLYKSGDLARKRADGNIECCGRKDDQVKMRGFRIELSEIEQVMERISGISYAKVLLVHDADITCLAAYYTAKEMISINDIDDELRRQLPYYMIPTYYIHVDSFKYNVNGKLDKHSLPNFRSGMKYISQKENSLEIDQKIGLKFLKYCAQVLKLPDVSYDDQFVNLGGDSLMAFELNSLLESEWNTVLNLCELVGQYTLGHLAELLTRQINFNKEKKQQNLDENKGWMPNTYQKILLKEERRNKSKIIDKTQKLPLYNMIYILELSQCVSKELLQEAFNAVLQRHEMLRTHFVEISNSYEISWDEYKEYTVSKEYVSDIRSINLIDYVKEFNVLLPGLYQMILFEDKKKNQCILLNIHHILVDYISICIIVKELFLFYYNREAEIPRYSEREYFINRTQVNILCNIDFWKNKLHARPKLVKFTEDQDNLRVSECTDSICFEMKNKDEIRRFCGKWGITEYYLFLGTLALLLYFEEKEKEFIIGTYSMGRVTQEVPQHIIGFFTDTIPFCFYIQDSVQVGNFLQLQKEKGIEMLQYGGIDVGNIVRYMNLEDLCKGSLFEVSFNYMQEYRLEFEEEKQEIVLHDYSKNPQLIAFSLTGISKKNSVCFELIFKSNKYSCKKMRLLIEKYSFIIHTILNNGNYIISNLEEIYENKYFKE